MVCEICIVMLLSVITINLLQVAINVTKPNAEYNHVFTVHIEEMKCDRKLRSGNIRTALIHKQLLIYKHTTGYFGCEET